MNAMNTSSFARTVRDKSSLLSFLAPFALALGCARAWTSVTFAGTMTGLSSSALPHACFDVGLCALSLVVALSARRMLPFFAQPWTLPVSFLCMLASSVCWLAQIALPVQTLSLGLAGAVLGGVGFATFLLLWSETLCGVSVVRIALYTSAGMLAGSAIAFFAAGMDPLREGTLVLALPCVAVGALVRSHATVPESGRQSKTCPAFRHPWKLYALFGIWAFAYGLRTDQLASGAGMHSSLSTAIVSAGLFLFVLFVSDRTGLAVIYRSPVLLIVCGFLLIPAEGLIGTTASSYLISMGYTLSSTLIALLLYDISKRLGIAIVALVSVKNALQVCVGAGQATGRLVEGAFPAQSTDAILAAVVIAVVALSMVLLFSERELASKWGVTILAGKNLVERSADEEALEEACRKLSERYGLSPRESEILTLVAQGKTGREIAEGLYIAEGTCKAHTRHIYEKMGIHSRKELHAIVAGAQGTALQDATAPKA